MKATPFHAVRRRRATLALAGTVALASAASAATVAVTWSGAIDYGVSPDSTIGWSFTAAAPFTVTDLGYFDYELDGLLFAHAVDIWDGTGVLKVAGTVPAGTLGTLLARVRYTPVTPVTLPAGTYTIGAFFPAGTADYYQSTATSIITDPNFTYLGTRLALNPDTPIFPTGDVYGVPGGIFGPNFQFTTPTPEPTAGLLLLLGSVSALGTRRTRSAAPHAWCRSGGRAGRRRDGDEERAFGGLRGWGRGDM